MRTASSISPERLRIGDALGYERSKQLEEENRKLKRTVADLALDKEMLQDVIELKL